MGRPWITTDTFTASPSWGSTPAPVKPEFDDSDANKRLYGIELAKGLSAYEAAQIVFPVTNGTCVWVSQKWPADPVVNAAKDQYLQAIELKAKDLDKEAYLAILIDYYRETYTMPSGQQVYVNEGKDRLKALELYGKAKNYINDKNIEINNTNNVDNSNNFVSIKLVKAEVKQPEIINTPNTQSKILNNDELPQLKLVAGSSR